MPQRYVRLGLPRTSGSFAKGVLKSALTQDFVEGEVLFREPPFVAGQHALNRSKAVVCASCFRFLGSVELQIAWHLLCDKYEGIICWDRSHHSHGASCWGWLAERCRSRCIFEQTHGIPWVPPAPRRNFCQQTSLLRGLAAMEQLLCQPSMQVSALVALLQVQGPL